MRRINSYRDDLVTIPLRGRNARLVLMRKRAASASAAAKSVTKGKSTGHDAFFTSPDPSSKPYHFDLPSFPTATAASSSLNTTPASYLRHPPSPPPSAKDKTTTLATISDLKALASSRIDSLKRHLDLCRSDILRDFDASNTRLSKRFKVRILLPSFSSFV